MTASTQLPELAELAERLRALDAKATPGPWYQSGPPWFRTGSIILAGSPDGNVADRVGDTDAWGSDRDEQRAHNEDSLLVEHPEDDAALIVALRNDLPRILGLEAEVARLTKERGEALDRVEELEREADSVSTEFEKECWVALRSVLTDLGFLFDGDPITVDDALGWIREELRHRERQAALTPVPVSPERETT